MIALENVSKRYVTDHIPGEWVLQDLSLTFRSNARIGVVGDRGSGKSTLLRLIAGTETPTIGTVKRDARVATPSRYSRSFQPLLSGRQNAKFICRINGSVDDIEERLKGVEHLAALGDKFERPLSTYTPTMKSRLSFALSLALDFDTYISDGFDFSGDIGFRNKELAEQTLDKMFKTAGVIMVAKGVQGNAFLRRYCESGIWLHDGHAEWFDNIEEAIEKHKAHQPKIHPAETHRPVAQTIPECMQPATAKIKQLGYSLRILSAGIGGAPHTVSEKECDQLVRAAALVEMLLLTPEQITERGSRVLDGMVPILKKRLPRAGKEIGLYDFPSQCEGME